MAALDFPANPINGQTYALNGVTYYYNSSMGAWLTQLTSMNIASSSNTQVLFNDAGIANGSVGLTYNKSANTLSANTINVNTMVVTGNLQIGTGTTTITGSSINVSSVLSPTGTVNITSNIQIGTGTTTITGSSINVSSVLSPTGTVNVTSNLNLSLSTSHLLLPTGTTAQRPSGANGMIRFNSDTGRIEHYFNSAWADNINKAGDFAWKEGASSYGAAYKFNWAKGGRRGTSLDASTYGYGILINEAGYYTCDFWWRCGDGNHGGLGINGNRGTLETADSYGIWGHDHAGGGASWSLSRYVGYMEAGWILTGGAPSSGYGNFGTEGYDAGMTIIRLI